MFDLPDTTPIEVEPVPAVEHVVELPPYDRPLAVSFSAWNRDRDDEFPFPAVTPDVRVFAGGTHYMPTTEALASGDPPPPWQGSVAQADRRINTRGAYTVPSR